MSSAGFRLRSDFRSLAQQHRRGTVPGACSQVLSGQVDSEALAVCTLLDPTFLLWLVDPADASATAFWEVLACAQADRIVFDRRARCRRQRRRQQRGRLDASASPTRRFASSCSTTSRCAWQTHAPDELDAVGIARRSSSIACVNCLPLDLNRLAAMRTSDDRHRPRRRRLYRPGCAPSPW
jgi:hypothetical protein